MKILFFILLLSLNGIGFTQVLELNEISPLFFYSNLDTFKFSEKEKKLDLNHLQQLDSTQMKSVFQHTLNPITLNPKPSHSRLIHPFPSYFYSIQRKDTSASCEFIYQNILILHKDTIQKRISLLNLFYVDSVFSYSCFNDNNIGELTSWSLLPVAQWDYENKEEVYSWTSKKNVLICTKVENLDDRKTITERLINCCWPEVIQSELIYEKGVLLKGN